MDLLGYIHTVVRISKEIGKDLLPNYHRVASLLRRCWLGTHQVAVSQEHFDCYLDE